MNPSRKVALMLSAATALSAVVTMFGNAGEVEDLPRCLTRTLIAFETAVSPAEVRQIVNQSGFDAAGMRWSLRADYAFMFSYAALFVYFGWLTRQRRLRGAAVAGPLAMLFAVVALGCDFMENQHAWSVLSGGGDVAAMRFWSLAKWGAVGLTTVFLFFAFLPKSEGSPTFWLLSCAIAWLSLLGGFLAIWGVFDNRKLEVCLTPLLLTIPLQLAFFARYWTSYLGSFRHPQKA